MDFPVELEEIEVVDSGDTRYTKVKIWLMSLGYNPAKGIDFPKEVVDMAIPSLKNIPIVSSVGRVAGTGKKDFLAHEPVQNIDGSISHGTKVIGVIPETNNAKYEVRMCEEYNERTFLTVEGLVWTSRAEEELDILYKDGGVKSHSMELDRNGTDYVMTESGLIVPTKITFDGACILGDHVRPAMEGSTLELFSADLVEFSKEIQGKLDGYYSTKEGGDKVSKKAKDTKKKDDIEVIEEEVKKEDKKAEKATEETKVDKVDKKAEEKSVKKEESKKEDVKVETEPEEKAEKAAKETDKAEEVVKEKSKVEVNNGKAKLPIDFSIEDYEAMKIELEELRNFKAEADKQLREEQLAALFSKYQSLNELDEYKAIKEKASEFSIEDLDKEFALIFANNIEKLNFSDGEDDKIDEDNTNYSFTDSIKKQANTKYGGLLEKHGLNE